MNLLLNSETFWWQHVVMPTLQEEDRVFVTEMNRKKVWVIDDGSVFTLLFLEDY
jgi:hypothetical protein